MIKLTELFAMNLKKARNKFGYSQVKLAELCSCSVGIIAEYELGNSFPSASSLEKLSSVLGLKPFQLLLDEENQDKLDKYTLLTNIYNEFKNKLNEDWENIIKKYF